MKLFAYSSFCLLTSIAFAADSTSCNEKLATVELFSTPDDHEHQKSGDLDAWRSALASGKNWKRDRIVRINLEAFADDLMTKRYVAESSFCTGAQIRITPFADEPLIVRHEHSYAWEDAPGFIVWKGVVEGFPLGRSRVRFIFSEEKRRVESALIVLPGKRFSVEPLPDSDTLAMVYEAYDTINPNDVR